jgi:putative membrane protein
MLPDPSHETRAREHLANERTLLAWVRTSLALMGLGFVVARFGLFLRQLAAETRSAPEPGAAISTPLGVMLVATGLVVMVLATVRFFRARAQIERGGFEPEAFAEMVLVALTLAGGAGLIAYLFVVR